MKILASHEEHNENCSGDLKQAKQISDNHPKVTRRGVATQIACRYLRL